jgi:hypothetical protein
MHRLQHLTVELARLSGQRWANEESFRLLAKVTNLKSFEIVADSYGTGMRLKDYASRLYAQAKPFIQAYGAAKRDPFAVLKIMWLPRKYPWEKFEAASSRHTVDAHFFETTIERYRRRTVRIKSKLAYKIIETLSLQHEIGDVSDLMVGFAEHAMKLTASLQGSK